MKTILLTVMIMFVACASFAEDGYLKSRPVQKLKRGAINIVTAPIEIPKKIKVALEESGDHPAEKVVSLFGGLVKGITYTVGRIGSGLWDIVTLNLDIPSGSESLMKPEYVLESWND